MAVGRRSDIFGQFPMMVSPLVASRVVARSADKIPVGIQFWVVGIGRAVWPLDFKFFDGIMPSEQ